MGKVVIDMSMSLDGFIATPNDSPEEPLGEGGGTRLFDHLGTKPIELEQLGVIESPGVTHLSFRVLSKDNK
jgi:hypothetical protein